MGSGGQAVGNSTQSNQYGVQTGGTLSYGGTPMTMNNPGSLTPDQLNPSAGNYVDQNQSLYNNLSQSSLNPFNTNMYNQMQQSQQAGLNSGLQNMYAAQGLGGSSAAMGGIANADIQNSLAVQRQQMGAQMQYSSALGGLNQQGYQDTMGIQNQYGDFESAYNQSIASLLGVQEGANNSQNQMTGQIIGGALGAGGSIAGGAMG